MSNAHIKFIILGEQSVGKTSIIDCIDDSYHPPTQPTIGMDIRRLTLDVNGEHIDIMIHDTSGMEQFRAITRTFYRSTNAAIIVYDITDARTFNEVQNFWVHQAREMEPNLQFILLGNKIDKVKSEVSSRQVSREKAQELASEMGWQFEEIQATDTVQTQQILRDMCIRIIPALRSNIQSLQEEVFHVQQTQVPRRSCCFF